MLLAWMWPRAALAEPLSCAGALYSFRNCMKCRWMYTPTISSSSANGLPAVVQRRGFGIMGPARSCRAQKVQLWTNPHVISSGPAHTCCDTNTGAARASTQTFNQGRVQTAACGCLVSTPAAPKIVDAAANAWCCRVWPKPRDPSAWVRLLLPVASAVNSDRAAGSDSSCSSRASGGATR